MKIRNTSWIVSILIIILIGTISCKKDSDSEPEAQSPQLQLRIMNDVNPATPGNQLTGSITVIITSNEASPDFDGYKATVDFGTLNIGQTSEYKRVSNRFKIKVNNQDFASNDGLGIGANPSTKWILKIRSIQNNGGSNTYGYDLSAE
ncbi:MAG: hypothetical protein K9G42_04515 [Pedobacter sp.]|jgi:hypothetical protein|nr:hypothetical protein [Pedobacter sp.]